MIATAPAPMIKGARRLTFDESHTVVQMDTAAKEFGGTVILSVGRKFKIKTYVTT